TVVVARDDVALAARLVAYVVPPPNAAPASNELRAFLQERLPSYMVPTFIVLLDALPLGPNGKVHRQALPVPRATVASSPIGGPRDPVARALAELWQATLGAPPAADASFFGMGGDSLLAARLMAGVEERLGRRVPLASFLRDDTFASLTARLGETAAAQSW